LKLGKRRLVRGAARDDPVLVFDLPLLAEYGKCQALNFIRGLLQISLGGIAPSSRLILQ